MNCLDNFRLLERARLVVVDHLKYLSRGLRAAPSVMRQCRHGRQRASADVREGFGRVGVLHRWRLGAAVRLRRLRKGFGRRGRAFKNSRLNSSSAFSAARWRRSRSSASCSRRFFRPRWMADSHSSMSISPEPSSSSTSSAFLSRGGWRRNCRFSSPQVLRKSITSLSSFTALTCVKIKQ